MLTTRIATPLVPPATSLFTSGQPLDLVSLADVKLELDVTETADDPWLQKIITRASRAAARYCNRIFQPTLWQDSVWPGKDAYPWQLPPAIAPLQLHAFPILSPPSPAGTAPPQAPVLSVSAGGSLAPAVYYVRISYLTAAGETAASLESRISLAAGQVFNVAAPGPDGLGVATSWNVYAGTKSFQETLQNASPIGIETPWTLPTSGLVAGAALPAYATFVENAVLAPTPLTENVDFTLDRYEGQATRLYQVDLQPKPWALPIVAVYSAGYASIDDDLQDAVILMVKGRWFGRSRDPLIRSQNTPGVYEAAYFFATGPGGEGDLPIDAMAKLDRYRVPVAA